jgi:hypothetical protein
MSEFTDHCPRCQISRSAVISCIEAIGEVGARYWILANEAYRTGLIHDPPDPFLALPPTARDELTYEQAVKKMNGHAKKRLNDDE